MTDASDKTKQWYKFPSHDSDAAFDFYGFGTPEEATLWLAAMNDCSAIPSPMFSEVSAAAMDEIVAEDAADDNLFYGNLDEALFEYQNDKIGTHSIARAEIALPIRH